MKYLIDTIYCVTVVTLFGLGLVGLGMIMWFLGTYGG
jgi:hypothetical protein